MLTARRRRPSLRQVLLGVFVAGFGLVPTAAGADTKSVPDERTESQKVDPVEATHGHHESLRGVLVHTFRMAEPWQDGDLFGIQLQVWLPDDDRAPDRVVYISSNPDGSMYALVDDQRGRTRGYGNAWLVDDRTVRLDLPKPLLTRNLRSYQWAVIVSFACSAPEGATCIPEKDRVPNRGRVRHKL